MPPDAGQQAPGADAQRNGHDIARAVEQGIANHDLSQAIQLIQQTERNLSGKPQDLKGALEVANRELERSQNPTVQKYFAKHEIVGTDPTKGGLALTLDQGKGEKIYVNKDGQAYQMEAGTVKQERQVSPDGNLEIIKYTSADGKQQWEVDRAKQADGSLRVNRIIRPDGTQSQYAWGRTQPGGPVEPVGMQEFDNKQQMVRNYEVARKPDGTPDPSVWKKISGPQNDFPRIYGKLEVSSNGNDIGTHRFLMEGYQNKEGTDVRKDQLITLKPDGRMKTEAKEPPQGAQLPGTQKPRS